MGAPHFDLVTSTDTLKALIDKLLAEQKPIGFDLETGYLGPNRKKGSLRVDWDQQFICGFSITNSEHWARYVPVAHEYGPNLPEEQTWELMKPVLETLPSLAHNGKFEIRNLRALERKGRGPRIDLNLTGDTMIQSYVLSMYQRHNLKDLVRQVFDYDQPQITTLFPEAKKKDLDALRFNVLSLEDHKVRDYACEDAVWPLRLNDYFLPLVQAQRRHIYEVEMRVVRVLCDMEDAGHAVDWAGLREAYAVGLPFEMEMQIAAKTLLSEMAGEDLSALNLASTLQMREVLYDKIGLSTPRRTAKGEMSTDAIALEALSREHSAVKKVLEVREVHNLTNRLDKWITEYSGDHDDRAHPSFNQVVVPSGRFSANDPAIQQLPKKWRWTVYPKVDPWNEDHWAQVLNQTTFGKHHWAGNFRDFLVAAPGCYLLGFDYSQIELRALAGAHLRRESPGHTLQPTALVHEAWLKLVEQTEANWKNRSHFFAVAATLMRQIVVDYARRQRADKRGGGATMVCLDDVSPAAQPPSVDVLALDQALEALSAIDVRQGGVVELRFFGGLDIDEVAEALGISTATVEREWALAKAWLHRRLSPLK